MKSIAVFRYDVKEMNLDIRHVCPRCQSSYKNKVHLYRHLNYECGVEPKFTCKFCFRKFKHKQNMKVHQAKIHGMINCNI